MAIASSNVSVSENQLYKKFLLFIEVAPAMIKVLRRGSQNGAGEALTARLDRVVRQSNFEMIYMPTFIIDRFGSSVCTTSRCEWSPQLNRAMAQHQLGPCLPSCPASPWLQPQHVWPTPLSCYT